MAAQTEKRETAPIQETRPVNTLTKEDMKKIARIGGGRYREPSEYSESIHWADGQSYISLKRESCENGSTLIISRSKSETLGAYDLPSPPRIDVFNESSKITFYEHSVMIQTLNKPTKPGLSATLKIEPGKLTYNTTQNMQTLR